MEFLKHIIYKVKKNSKNFSMLKKVPFAMLVCLFLISCSSTSNLKYYQKKEFFGLNKLAVLPLENLTNDKNAHEKIRAILISELLKKGVEVLDPGEVNRALEEMKVASVGALRVAELQELGKKLSVDGIIVGSVENFEINRGGSVSFVSYPEVTINLRLIEVNSGKMLWSIRHSKNGLNFWVRHFGTEPMTLTECAREVVKEAVDTLFKGNR